MLSAIGRLRPGATLARAQNDLNVVMNRLSAEYPEAYDAAHTGFSTAALSVHDELTRQARPTLLVLLAITGFVLLSSGSRPSAPRACSCCWPPPGSCCGWCRHTSPTSRSRG